MFILCVDSGTFWLPWEPGAYRARAPPVPIPVRLVLPEASTKLRICGLSDSRRVVNLANLEPRTASLYLLTKSFVKATFAGDASLCDVRSARRRIDTHRVAVALLVLLAYQAIRDSHVYQEVGPRIGLSALRAPPGGGI